MFISDAFAQTAGAAEASVFQMFLPLILIFAVFYFLLIRPQQKKMKEHNAMLDAIRRGDRIVTGGGIVGTVARVNDNELLVDIFQDVRVTGDCGEPWPMCSPRPNRWPATSQKQRRGRAQTRKPGKNAGRKRGRSRKNG